MAIGRQRVFKVSLLVVWLMVALGIAVAAVLAIPSDVRSDYFWLRLIWTEILWALVALSASFMALVAARQEDSIGRFGGIAPAVIVVVAVYATLSFAAMVFDLIVAGGNSTTTHWILQIVFLVGAGATISLLSISRAGATGGLHFDRSKALSPQQMHDRLALEEASLHGPTLDGLRADVKMLRETLVFSLHESESLSNRADYQELSKAISALCSRVAALAADAGEAIGELEPLSQRARALAAKVKFIAADQVST